MQASPWTQKARRYATRRVFQFRASGAMSREYLSLQQRRLQKVDANRRVRDSAKLAQVICAEEGRSKRAAKTRKTPNPARFEVFGNSGSP
jgi:hypothetical protein